MKDGHGDFDSMAKRVRGEVLGMALQRLFGNLFSYRCSL